jgi:curved DNA-binding protein CbpA
MSDPYEILGLPRSADEGETRKRYLELVRQYPPDRDPSKFAEVRAAYEQLRDPVRRLEAQILEIDSGETLGAIAADVRSRLRDRVNHLPLDMLLAMAGSP